MAKIDKCKKYICTKTGCRESELKLKVVYQNQELTQFKLINAIDLVLKYGKNFSEYYNF